MPQGEAYTNYEAITVSTTAIPLTTIPGGCQYARVFVESQAVRFRLDGTVPTASEGEPVEAGSVIILDSRDQVTKFRVIRRDGSDATLRVHYAR
jgi:hypothetical protein